MGSVSGGTYIELSSLSPNSRLDIFNLCARSDEGELRSSVFVDEDAGNGAPLRSKSNPFLDVPHDKRASEIKEGLLRRKLHADIDGKRSEWDFVQCLLVCC